MKWAVFGVYIGLIDFISDKNEVFSLAEMNDVFYNFFGQTATGWIARVDNDEGARVGSFRTGLLKGFFKIRDRKRPIRFLSEEVWDYCAFQESQRSSIEWILRDRDENSIFWNGKKT